MEIKNAYTQKMMAQLKEWDAEINLLDAKLENVAADQKIKLSDELKDLRAKQHAASEKIAELEKASGDAWEQVKGTTDKVWDDLKNGLVNVRSKFK